MKHKQQNLADKCIWKHTAENEKRLSHPLHHKIKTCYYNCNGYDESCEFYISNRPEAVLKYMRQRL